MECPNERWNFTFSVELYGLYGATEHESEGVQSKCIANNSTTPSSMYIHILLGLKLRIGLSVCVCVCGCVPAVVGEVK